MNLPASSPTAVQRNVWPIMSGVLLVLLLASLDGTIVGTAMPRVIAQLNGFDRYAWVATAYLFTSTVTVPIYGKLSDLLGRKRIFLLGVLLFLLGSALCGAAQTMTQLIVFRGLQGLGAGALIPVAIAVVGDLFPPRERGKWQSLIGGIWGFASLVGPILGGWIADNLSWRWIFYVNLPIGLIALAVLTFVMPPLHITGVRARIDVVGAVLLVAGVIPVLMAVTLAGRSYPWLSWQVISLLVGAVAILVFFTAYEAKHLEPILQPRLFTNRIFSLSVAANTLIGAGMLGPIFLLPLFIQGVAGATATGSGAVFTPLMLAAIAGAAVSGQVLSRWGRYRYIALLSGLLMCAGMGLLLHLDVHTRPADILPALVVLGVGFGLSMALYTIVAQNAFPQGQLGQVSGVLTFFRSIGGTIGVAVTGSLLTERYTSMLRAQLPASVTGRISASQLHALQNPQRLLQSGTRAAMERALTESHNTHLYAVMLGAIKGALAGALHDVFVAGALIVALSFLVVVFLPEVPLRGREVTSETPEAVAV